MQGNYGKNGVLERLILKKKLGNWEKKGWLNNADWKNKGWKN